MTSSEPIAQNQNCLSVVPSVLCVFPGSEGEPQGSEVSCLDHPRVSEGFLTAPPSGEVTPTTPAPHEQALVSLETTISQQVHQPITDLLLAESHANSLATLAGAGLPDLTASSDRLNCEAEASQMEMSPAPPIGERRRDDGWTSFGTVKSISMFVLARPQHRLAEFAHLRPFHSFTE